MNEKKLDYGSSKTKVVTNPLMHPTTGPNSKKINQH
jgi:hypothetical protein